LIAFKYNQSTTSKVDTIFIIYLLMIILINNIVDHNQSDEDQYDDIFRDPKYIQKENPTLNL